MSPKASNHLGLSSRKQVAALRLRGSGFSLLEQEIGGSWCLGPRVCEGGVGHTLENREGTPGPLCFPCSQLYTPEGCGE